MGNEFKRLVLIGVAVFVSAGGILMLPFMKLRLPQRPANVPATALYATGSGYWIDCPNLGGVHRYYCTVYSPNGEDKLVQGVFQEAGVSWMRRVAYDGSMIHWRHSLLLTSVRLDCVEGGQPPDIIDCRKSGR